MKLLKVALSIFCIFSVVKIQASDTIDIDQAYIGLIIKITSMSDDIASLQEKYKLLSGEKTTEGLDLEMAFFNLKKKADNLNNEILSLKEQYELLAEKERINSQKISELFEMLELKITKVAVKETVIDGKKNNDRAAKIYDDARKFLLAGENKNAIELFQNYLENYQDYKNFADATYWLGRAYSANKSYLEAKDVFVRFQNENTRHAKFANSMYDLANALIELNELEAAKNVLTLMLEKFPEHSLNVKAKQKLKELL
jgi:TolA-binding protein